jgi:hypothetical protein
MRRVWIGARRALSLSLLLAAAACNGRATDTTRPAAPPPLDPAVIAAAAAEITPARVHERVAFLASDALRGRDTPSPGLDSAAAYLARAFAALGLDAAGEGGTFYQHWPYPLLSVAAEEARLVLEGPAGRSVLAYGDDFAASPGTTGAATGGLVFLGSAASLELAPGSLRERVAVVYLGGAPGYPWLEQAEQARRSVATAGAAGLVLVLDPGIPHALMGAMAREFATPQRVFALADRIPAVFLRYPAAERLFAQAGLQLDALRSRAVRGVLEPVPLPGITAELAAGGPAQEGMPANVVALFPGSDPALRHTYVVLTAHYDHLGVGTPDARGDSIYNGADDNASGTAALVEIARAFAALPRAPARSLLFVAVSGEEKGLLGSRYFTENPTVPLQQMVANINLDMIARNAPDTIVVIGQELSSLGPLTHRITLERPELGLVAAPDPWPQERFFFRSDHFNFARRGIPALFFFAGVHEDYHRPSDTVEKIDAGKAARVARLAFYTAHAIASDPEPPRWTAAGRRTMEGLTR